MLREWPVMTVGKSGRGNVRPCRGFAIRGRTSKFGVIPAACANRLFALSVPPPKNGVDRWNRSAAVEA